MKNSERKSEIIRKSIDYRKEVKKLKIIDGNLIGLVSTDMEDGAIVEKRKYVFRVRLEDGTLIDLPVINIGKEHKKKENQSKQFKKLKEEPEDIDEEVDVEDMEEEVPDIDEEEGSYV